MKRIYLIIFFAATTMTSSAQEAMASFQYSVGFPMGDFNDYIEKTSWRGVQFGYRKMTNENMGLGFDLGWNFFEERKDYATYTSGTESITGVQYRYCHTVPIYAAMDYYFKPGESLNPFVGLGVGTMYSRNDLNMGLYSWYRDVWHFAVRPEAGVIIHTSGVGIIISAQYNNAFETDRLKSRNYLGATIGFAWTY